MKLKRMHWMGIIAGGVVLVGALVMLVLYKDMNLALFLSGIAAGVLAVVVS